MQVRVFHISPCSPQRQQTVRVTYLLLISLVPVINLEDDWEQLSFVFVYLGKDEKVHKLVYSVYLSIPISPFSTPPPGDFGEGGEEGSVRGCLERLSTQGASVPKLYSKVVHFSDQKNRCQFLTK